MISNAHFWNAGARSYNPICLNPLLVLEKITPLPGSSEYTQNVPEKIQSLYLLETPYKSILLLIKGNFIVR